MLAFDLIDIYIQRRFGINLILIIYHEIRYFAPFIEFSSTWFTVNKKKIDIK